jgi:hypothetical protein
MATLSLGLRSLDPILNAKAWAAAFLGAAGDPAALKLAKLIPWTTRNGAEASLYEMIHYGRRLGVASQLDENLVAPITRSSMGEKLFHQIERAGNLWDTPGVRYLSLGYLSKVMENFQHFLPWLGAVEDFTDRGLARALDFTSKYSSNAARLGLGEMGVIRNSVGFYSWLRYIVPHTIAMLKESPRAMKIWEQYANYRGREFNFQTPIQAWGSPMYPEGAGAAPLEAQPQRYKPDLLSHEYAVRSVDTPLRTGLSFISAIENGLGMGYGNATLAKQLGPGAAIVLGMITAVDIATGKPMGEFINLDTPQTLGSSVVGYIAMTSVQRPFMQFYDMYKLYHDYDRDDEGAVGGGVAEDSRDVNGVINRGTVSNTRQDDRRGVRGTRNRCRDARLCAVFDIRNR